MYCGINNRFLDDRHDKNSISRIDIKQFIKALILSPTQETKYYDIAKSIYPDELTKMPLRFAIRRRNSYMIDKADYVICYMNNPFSNTFTNVKEAAQKKKQIINLGEYNKL